MSTRQRLIHKVVKELKARISDKYEIQEMRVFGSSARGDCREDSDIDIFVHLLRVNRQIEEALFDIAYEMELRYDCLIDLIVFGDDTMKKKYPKPPIYHKVLSEGMKV